MSLNHRMLVIQILLSPANIAETLSNYETAATSKHFTLRRYRNKIELRQEITAF